MGDFVLVYAWHRVDISRITKISSTWVKVSSLCVGFYMFSYVLTMPHNKGAFVANRANRFTIILACSFACLD